MRKRGKERYPEFLTTGVAAKYCGVSKVTILRWIGKEYLKAFRLPTGHYRIQRDDFCRFLEENAIPIHQERFRKRG